MRSLYFFVPLFCGQFSAIANNTLFLPGDAFFFTRLTIAEIEALRASESPILRYRNHRDGGFGCGTFGFQYLEIVNMTRVEKQNLAVAYRRMIDELETDLDGEKTASVLIYNQKYDWQKHGIGLQYNEDWGDETTAFGAVRKYLRVESFIDYGEPRCAMFIERNWRDSNLVPPLQTDSPPLSEQKHISKSPVKMSAPRRMIVLPNRDFDSYFTPKNGVRLFVISDGLLEEMRYTDRKWQAK